MQTELWTPTPRAIVTEHLDDGAMLELRRGFKVQERLRMGPNEVHAFITHPDGSTTDLGVEHNLLTTLGRDWFHDMMGGIVANGAQGSPLTAVSATSATATGTPWQASNFATPILGLAGKVIVVPVTGLTTTPVMGLIGSNTTSVATIDKWWTPDFAGTGTTPASTSAFVILPGRSASPLFMALTTDSAAASAADTALASELTTNGAARSKATFAHTLGATTSTLQVTFAITGAISSIHKLGLLTCSTPTAGGIMVFESVLSADATVGSGDTLTVTDTVTLS
jgi:hypothetical protein